MAGIAGLLGAAAGFGAGLLHHARAKEAFNKALADAGAKAGAVTLPSPEDIAAANARDDEVNSIADKLLGLPLTKDEAHDVAARLQALVEDQKAGGKSGAAALKSALAGFVAEVKSEYMLSDADAQQLTQIASEYASHRA